MSEHEPGSPFVVNISGQFLLQSRPYRPFLCLRNIARNVYDLPW